MRIDGINLIEGSSINNATLASGADFPSNADIGELFLKLALTLTLPTLG